MSTLLLSTDNDGPRLRSPDLGKLQSPDCIFFGEENLAWLGLAWLGFDEMLRSKERNA